MRDTHIKHTSMYALKCACFLSNIHASLDFPFIVGRNKNKYYFLVLIFYPEFIFPQIPRHASLFTTLALQQTFFNCQ